MTRGGAAAAAAVGVVLALALAWLTAPDEVSLTAGASARSSPASGERAPRPPSSVAERGQDTPGVPPSPTPHRSAETPPAEQAAARQARAPRTGRLDPGARVALPADDRGAPAGAHDAVGGGAGSTAAGFRGPRAEERAAVLEERVVDLLVTVAPELDGVPIARSCTENGRSCTFEGPWPGDDFASRWVDALASGALEDDALGGATFSAFERIEGADGERFQIEARQPPGRVLE